MYSYNSYGTLIPGGMFVGLGIGLLTGQVAAGIIIGLGVGMLLSPFFSALSGRKWKRKDLEKRLSELEKKIN